MLCARDLRVCLVLSSAGPSGVPGPVGPFTCCWMLGSLPVWGCRGLQPNPEGEAEQEHARLQRRHRNDGGHVGRGSSLVAREVQGRTAARPHFPPAGRAGPERMEENGGRGACELTTPGARQWEREMGGRFGRPHRDSSRSEMREGPPARQFCPGRLPRRMESRPPGETPKRSDGGAAARSHGGGAPKRPSAGAGLNQGGPGRP